MYFGPTSTSLFFFISSRNYRRQTYLSSLTLSFNSIPSRLSLVATDSGRLDGYLASHLAHPVPKHANPTDHALDVVSTDFIHDHKLRENHIEDLAEKWKAYDNIRTGATSWQGSEAWNSEFYDDHETEANRSGSGSEGHSLRVFFGVAEKTLHLANGTKVNSKAKGRSRAGLPQNLTLPSLPGPSGSLSSCAASSGNSLKKGLRQTRILMERNMVNYSRNILAYGVRLAMYCE